MFRVSAVMVISLQGLRRSLAGCGRTAHLRPGQLGHGGAWLSLPLDQDRDGSAQTTQEIGQVEGTLSRVPLSTQKSA